MARASWPRPTCASCTRRRASRSSAKHFYRPAEPDKVPAAATRALPAGEAGDDRRRVRRLEEGPGRALRRRRLLRPDLPARPMKSADRGRIGRRAACRMAPLQAHAAHAPPVRRAWTPAIAGLRPEPGLGLAWLGLIVLLPLAALAWKAAGLGLDGWLRAIHDPRVQASLKLSFGAALVAALIASRRRRAGGLGGGALSLPGPAPARRAGRSAVRAADRGRRHRADRDLFAERLGRALAGAARHQDRLRADRHRDRADVHRPAVRGAHGAAGAGNARARTGGSGRIARRRPLHHACAG